jgi:hypothetical protein
MAQLAYNNAYREDLHSSPLKIWMGVDARVAGVDSVDTGAAEGDADTAGGGTGNDDAEVERPEPRERAAWLSKMRQGLADLWAKTAERMSRQYNRKHQPMEFKVGDYVLLTTKDSQLSVPCRKLAPKFDGPYRVAERTGKQTYRLDLPRGSRRHNVFNVSKLELYRQPVESRLRREGVGDEGVPPVPLPQPVSMDEQGANWELETIVGERTKNGRHGYLVRWRGFEADDPSWVPDQDMDGAAELVEHWKQDHPQKRARAQKLPQKPPQKPTRVQPRRR